MRCTALNSGKRKPSPSGDYWVNYISINAPVGAVSFSTKQRRTPAVAAARMDWVMSPSSGDALLCFVKRAVPAGSKCTNWYRQSSGCCGDRCWSPACGYFRLSRAFNCPAEQLFSAIAAMSFAHQPAHSPQRWEHLASYGTTLCRGSINALIVAPWSLPRRQTESPRWLGVLSASSLTCTFRLPGLFARARSGLSPLTSPDR